MNYYFSLERVMFTCHRIIVYNVYFSFLYYLSQNSYNVYFSLLYKLLQTLPVTEKKMFVIKIIVYIFLG